MKKILISIFFLVSLSANAMEKETTFNIDLFDKAQSEKWNEVPGRIDLLKGIAYYEIDQLSNALKHLELAFEFEESKGAAEGWIQYINQSIGT